MTQLRTMSQSEYDLWLAESIAGYAKEKVASGQWSRERSLQLSRQEYAALLPRGLATPENHLFTITDDQGEPVGMLWYAVTTQFEKPVAYIYDVVVLDHRRREGHALADLQLLEQEAQQRGLTGISLHVFGHNTGARALYEKLGYGPTSISLFKPLGLLAT